MLDKQQHEYYLKRILRDIISNPKLNTQLVFKGGTCLYMFYGLDRFSVDLDFDFYSKDDFLFEEMHQILNKHLNTAEGKFRAGKYGWLWQASYKKGLKQMQIDVGKTVYPDKYKIKQFYGLSVNTLDESSLFAHKLCAILDRNHFQNRDLFDSYFMFDKMFDINEEVIKIRTNQSLLEYLRKLEIYISTKVDRRGILHGLGELVDEKKKHWVKNNLIDELLFQLRLKIEVLEK